MIIMMKKQAMKQVFSCEDGPKALKDPKSSFFQGSKIFFLKGSNSSFFKGLKATFLKGLKSSFLKGLKIPNKAN